MFDAKTWMKNWKCAPQLKHLPRDGRLDITCRKCRRHWSESVRHLVEDQRMGAQFLDLFEWEMRCKTRECGGMVCCTLTDDEYDLLQAA